MQRFKFKRAAALTAAAALAAMTALCAVPAMAATTYTPVAGTSTTFNKYLIMDEGDNVPNVTFSFTVAPGAARSADTSDNSVMQVLPGIGTPTIADVTFSDSDSTVLAANVSTQIDVQRAASDRATGLTAATGVELESGEKFATKQATVSFSGITFPEPGIYRYIITETADSDHATAGIMHDNDVDRVLDVYVVHTEGEPAISEAWFYEGTEYATETAAQEAADTHQGVPAGTGDYSAITHREAQAATSSGLTVASYVLHKNDSDVVINATMGSADVAAAGAALSDKTDGFTNEYNTKDLVFKKEVIGNQGSRDKWFEFTVTLDDVNDDDVYTISIADDNNAATTDGNADATSGTTAATRASNQSKTNVTSATGEELKAGVKFYLQHGQSIAIRGIAPNATGYTNATTGVIGTVAGNNKAVMTSFQNERAGVIPTGIILSGAIGIGVLAIGAGGFAAVKVSKKKREHDED